MPRKTESSNEIKTSIPKIDFSNKNLLPILVVLLIIAAFFLGSLTTKVQYLEKGGTNEEAEVQAAQDQEAQGPQNGDKVEVGNGHLPPLGNKDAKNTIVVFSEFECPFCARFYSDAYAQIKKDYVDTGKAKVYFRHYPLDQMHPMARPDALASECANEQGKFWEMHDKIFDEKTTMAEGETITNDTLKEWANELGLDTNKFNQCFDSNKYDAQITKDFSEGQAAGVNGTPTTFINGVMVVGAQPYEEFKKTLDSEIK